MKKIFTHVSKFYFLLICFLTISAVSFSQTISQYAFSTVGTGSLALDRNGNAVDMGTGTTQLVGANSDDGVSGVINIGFPFTFMSTGGSTNTFTQFSVSANGLVRLGSTAVSGGIYGNAFPPSNQTVIAPYLQDLYTSSSGKVHYKLVGSYPNRALVIEFLNMNINYNSSTADGTFQVRLYEQTNVIEFVYGAMKVGSASTTNASSANAARYASIGFSNTTTTGNTGTYYVSQSSPYVTSTSTAIVNNNNATGVIAGLNSSANGSRRVFTFIPTLSYKSQFISMNIGSTTWCAGETRNVTIIVKNIGTATWTNASPDINIGIKWNTNGANNWADYYVRTDANGLAPGATDTFTLPITASNFIANTGYTTPLSAGTNNLTFDVVQEGVSWFGDNGGGTGPGNVVYKSDNITIVTPASITTQPTNKAACAGSATSFTVAATGTSLSYQWQLSTDNGGTWNNLSNIGVYTGATTATLNISNVNGLTGYQYRVIVTTSGGCGVTSGAATLTVNPVPTASISYSGTPYCSNAGTATVTQTGTTGGTYSSTSGLSINSTTGAINLAASTAGSYTVTYSFTNGTCPNTATAPVTITAQPVATFSYTGSPYCQNAANPSPTYSGGGSAGTFSSTAGLVFVSTSTGQVNLSASTPGTYTVTNTKTASGGCSQVTATSSITILALPVASISYTGSPYCLNAGTATVTVSGTTGGTYSASPAGLSINSSSGAITLASSTAGTYTVTYTFTSSTTGCTNSTTTPVTVNPIPVGVSASATPNPVCAGSVVALTSLPSAAPVLASQTFNSSIGAWTRVNNSSGGTVANAAWTIQNDGYTYGGVTFHSNDNSQFIITNSDAQGSNQNYTITQLVSPVFSTVGLTSCSLSFYQYLPNDFFDLVAAVDISTDGGSTWTEVYDYIDNGTIGSAAAFQNSVLSLNSYVGYSSVKIRFEFDSFYGLWWALDNITVTGGATGAPFTYAWTSTPAGFTASTQNTAATPSVNTTYNVSVKNSFNCSVSTSTPLVTINPKPTATLNNSSSQTICNGSSANLSISFTGTAPWSVSYSNGTTSATINNINSNPYTLTVSPTTTTTYTLTSLSAGDANCSGGTASGSATVTVNPTSVGGTVNGSTAVCISSNSGILNLTGQVGSVVQWEKSVDNGATWATVSNTTTSLAYSNLTQTTQYRAFVKSGVCSGIYSSVATVTVNPASVGGTANGSTSVCTGSSGTLNLTGNTGSIVRWESSTDGGATWNNIANTTANQSYSNITQTTQYRVLIQSGVCSSTYSSVAIITVNPASVGGSINGGVPVCSGSSGSLSLINQTGNVVQWEQSANGGASWTTLTNTSTTQSYTNITQTTQYRVLVKSGACSSAYSSVATVTVKPLPNASLVLTPANGAACAGTAVQVTFSGTSGASIDYGINPGSASNTTNANTQVASPSNDGDYVYTINSVTLNGCTGAISNGTATVHIVANPDASITGFDYVQIGNQINLTGGTGGGTWSSNNNGAATVNSSGVVNGVTSGTADISYSVNNTANGITCSNNSTKTITITADYVTRNDGNFSDIVTWKHGTVNGFVNASQIPTTINTIEVQHDLTLDQDFEVGSSKSFVMSGNGVMTINPNIVFRSSGIVNFNDKPVTVRSTAAGTGAIGINANAIGGATNVTVERYTDGGNNTSGRRAWRLITSPVLGQTIRDGWQEGGATNTGYGTLITGEGLTPTEAAAAGFDYIGGGNHTSIKEYTNGAWVPLAGNLTTGTQIPIGSQQAYMVFVRGNRTIGASGAGASTIRAKGSLYQGNQSVAVSTNPYTVVGNPYASSIDFGSLYSHNSASIKDQFYLWNSKIGVYGAYVLVDHNGSGGTYQATPAAITGIGVQSDDAYRYITSGSGFFVSPAVNAVSNTLTISETDKATNTPPVNPFRVVPNASNVRQLLVNLNQRNSDSSVLLADGFRAKFSADYEGNEEDNSSGKVLNFNENLSLIRNGISHIVEARGEVKKADTLYLKMGSVSRRAYQFQIKGENFTSAPGIQAWLEDNYLKTKQELSLSGSITNVNFDVNNDSLSWQSNRFRIVFENNSSVLPVTITKISAQPKSGGAEITWTVSNEVNIRQYTIEKSIDGGRTFAAVSTQPARNNPQAALTSYSGFDAKPKTGDNLYRIKIEAKDGSISYSQVVTVSISTTGTGIQITLYPNPVKEGKANLLLTNLKEDTYLVSVFSGNGRTVYQKKIYVTLANTAQTEPLLLGNLAQGSYQIRLADNNGNVLFTDKLIIAR